MIQCPICEDKLSAVRLWCEGCRTVYEGKFVLQRLVRLPAESQRLTEVLIEYGGNLKEMSKALEMSYPTLKKRLNILAEELRTLKEEDAQTIEHILASIESGTMSAKEGLKQIREINGEL